MEPSLRHFRHGKIKSAALFISVKRLISFLGLGIFLFANSDIRASESFFSEDKVVKKKESEDFFSEKKTKSDENSFWEEDASSEGEESIFDGITDTDDPILYAPPTGETGDPQKITPLGTADIFVFSIMTILWFIFCLRRSKYLKQPPG